MKNYPIAIEEKIREAVAIINDGDVWDVSKVERFRKTFPTLSMFTFHVVAHLSDLPLCKVGTFMGQSLVVCQKKDYEMAEAEFERLTLATKQETESKINALNELFGS